jgi:hypothetical protein
MHKNISFSADVGFTAASDLKDKTGLAVKVTTDGQVDIATAGGGDVIGILMNEPKKGAGAVVRMAGLAIAIAGATVAAGDYLKPDANGKLIKTTAPTSTISGALEHYIAIAQEAGSANQKITVQVLKGVYTI